MPPKSKPVESSKPKRLMPKPSPPPAEIPVKDPVIEEEKRKKVEKIVQQSVLKQKDLKTQEIQKKEAENLEKQKKQEILKEIELKAKEALKEAKLKPFEPKGKWGLDERNFKELTEKEKEKVKEEKKNAEKAKKEYRDMVKRQGRARIGLEIIELYPEIMKNRGNSMENKPIDKPVKEKNPEIQGWMQKKKLETKEKAMFEHLKQQEINLKRMHVLKELELLSKPQKKVEKPSKKALILNKLRKHKEKFLKNRSDIKSELANEETSEDFEFKGSFDFVDEEKDLENIGKKKKKLVLQMSGSFDREVPRPGAEISNYSDLNGEEDEESSRNKRVIQYKHAEDTSENEEADEQGNYGENEEFYEEDERFYEGNQGSDEEDQEFDEENEEFDEENEEFDEENEEFDEENQESDEESKEFDEDYEEYDQENENSDENSEESKRKPISQHLPKNDKPQQIKPISSKPFANPSKSNPKVQFSTKQPEDSPTDPLNNYPGNSKIQSGFEKYSIHPYATTEKPYKTQLPPQPNPPLLTFPLKSPESKEKVRSKLADLEKRIELKKTPQEKYEKIEVSDDFQINFYKLPGILETDTAFALSKIFSDVEVHKAATKIQSAVKGYLSRRNFIRIQHNIPSNRQINKDIHGILLKYYPEAYVPDFFSSSVIPESISLMKSSVPAKEIGINTENPVRKLEFYQKENDEYNLIEILAKENLLIHPDTSLEAVSYFTEEQYSEEFESVSEEINSAAGKYSSQISESIKESISAGKFLEKSGKNKKITESIQESLDEFKKSSMKESKNLGKKEKWASDSIQESIPDMYSSRFESIQESIQEKSIKNTTSGKGLYLYQSKQSEISEDIEGFKKTGSVKFLDEHISEEYSERKGNLNSKRSQSAEYEDDFESVSSKSLQIKNSLKLQKNEKNPISAQKLEEKLLFGLDALDRISEKELQIDALIAEKKRKMEEEFKKQIESTQRKQEMLVQELKREKNEDLNRFQFFMQEIMRQQKESFVQISETIAKTLQGVKITELQGKPEEKSWKITELQGKPEEKSWKMPEFQEKPQEKLWKIPEAQKKPKEKSWKVPEVQENSWKASEKSESALKSQEKTLEKALVSSEIEESIDYSSGRRTSSEKVTENSYKAPVKISETSIEEVYESQFESYNESISSSNNIPQPISRKPQISESSISEVYTNEFESIQESFPKVVIPSLKLKFSQNSIEESIKSSIQSFPLASPKLQLKSSKTIEESSEVLPKSPEEIYESQFESYNESTSLQVSPKKPLILITDESLEHSKPDVPKLSLPLKSSDPEIRFSQHKSSDHSESIEEEIVENIYTDDFESERSGKNSTIEKLKQSTSYRSNLSNFNTKFPVSDSFSSSNLSSPHKISARSRKSPDLRSSTSSVSEDIDIYDSFSKQSVNFENSIRRSTSLVDSANKKNSESIGESVYSEDFESESKSFRPGHSYGSDFESISHSDTKNFKGLHHSIKEVSPEESISGSISENISTPENNPTYSADFASESNSKKFKSDGDSHKNSLLNVPEERKSYEIAEEITETLFELLREDALLLLVDKDLTEIVEELYKKIIEDGLRLVPKQVFYPNNPNYLDRALQGFMTGLPESANPPALKSILQGYYKDIASSPYPYHEFSEFLPSSNEHKKSFKSMNKAIKDSINQLYTTWDTSLIAPCKPLYSKKEIQVKISKWINQKMGCIKTCIRAEERKQLDVLKEACVKEVLYQDFKEEDLAWVNMQDNGINMIESLEIKLALESEEEILDMLINEIKSLLT